MRRLVVDLAPAMCSVIFALALCGCRPSQSAAESTAVVVHGDPINGAAQNNSAIAAAPPVQTPVAEPVPPNRPPVTAAKVAPEPAIIAAQFSKPTEPALYQTVGFDKLASYNFEVADDAPVTNAPNASDKADEQIPAAVKAFNRQKVSIKGFMLPLKVQNGSVTEFLIMKDQSMCCYGNVPKITEWVNVKTSGTGVKPIMDQPVSILGTLHVGAMRENGYLIGIYQMDGEKMIDSGN